MPLEVLVPMVVLGVALTLWVTHALGGSESPPVSEAQARAAFGAEHPELAVERIDLDRSGLRAVVFTRDGRAALVKRLGDHLAVKLAVTTEWCDGRLQMQFGDVGWPRHEVTFAMGGKPDDVDRAS